METIRATVEGIIYRNEDNGYTVVDIDLDGDLETCVGMLPNLREGEEVEFTGEWKMHSAYGKQFSASSCRVLPPNTTEGLIRYLSSGIAPGVGEATAKRIVEHFGEDTLDVIHYAPERLTEVSGIGRLKASGIAQAMEEQIEQQDTMIFLQSLELGQALSGKIYKAYGKRTAEIITANPYRLADEIDGVGFLTADRIAGRLNISKESPERIRAGLRHVLSSAGNNAGHTCLPESELVEQTVKLLTVDEQMVNDSVSEMVLRRQIILRESEGTMYCYLPSFFYAEKEVAECLLRLSQSVLDQNDMEDAIAIATELLSIHLSEEQKYAVRASASQGVTVITGGPGTGKTTVIRSILEMFTQTGMKVELAAPTGRAAKRMTQVTEHEARTIHRLLEFSYDGSEGTFQRDEDNPIECDAIIIDEVSMVDIFLMESLLRAIEPGTRLILVGDSDQLPSVGPGMVLNDILTSGAVPVNRLTEVFRQAQESLIVTNAHRINSGIMPVLRGGKDFFYEQRNTSEEVLESVKAMISTRIPNYLGCDGMRDIQVLVPMRKGDLGVIRLNRELQAAFNPPGIRKKEFTHGDTIYREYDKVMQIKNNYQLEYRSTDENGLEEEGKGVFNGDVGVISAIDHSNRCFEVFFDDGRIVKYEFQQADELTLAYAVSIHKSQGSEFPVVLLPLLNGPEMLLTRNLLYTAVTRAKKMVVVIGSQKTVWMMVRNNRIVKRYSGLAAFLKAMGKTEAD